tara:strand:+ start:239 stop:937 length:699 start_codon:yes stop_codon:yes gene_type:complete
MDYKTCPECEFEKVPAVADECPDCGYTFEDIDIEEELESVLKEEVLEPQIAKIGIVSLIVIDENGDKTLTKVAEIQPGESLTFGRKSKVKKPDVNLADFIGDAGGISGMHFKIGDGILTDVGSTNGTYVIHNLSPEGLEASVKDVLIDQKFPNGWRDEPPIQLQLLLGIPLLPNEPYKIEHDTEFRAENVMLVYSEEEVEIVADTDDSLDLELDSESDNNEATMPLLSKIEL